MSFCTRFTVLPLASKWHMGLQPLRASDCILQTTTKTCQGTEARRSVCSWAARPKARRRQTVANRTSSTSTSKKQVNLLKGNQVTQGAQSLSSSPTRPDRWNDCIGWDMARKHRQWYIYGLHVLAETMIDWHSVLVWTATNTLFKLLWELFFPLPATRLICELFAQIDFDKRHFRTCVVFLGCHCLFHVRLQAKSSGRITNVPKRPLLHESSQSKR